MDTRKMNAELDKSLKEIVSHVTSMVINLVSAYKINRIQIINTMGQDKDHILVGTTTHGEGVVNVENIVTLE